jgi:hypothetical protein
MAEKNQFHEEPLDMSMLDGKYVIDQKFDKDEFVPIPPTGGANTQNLYYKIERNPGGLIDFKTSFIRAVITLTNT